MVHILVRQLFLNGHVESNCSLPQVLVFIHTNSHMSTAPSSSLRLMTDNKTNRRVVGPAGNGSEALLPSVTRSACEVSLSTADFCSVVLVNLDIFVRALDFFIYIYKDS